MTIVCARRPRRIAPTWASPSHLVAAGTIAWLGLTSAAAGAQQVAPSTDAMRVGVALSGGSARGFAHVGVLEALEQAGLRIDAVAGTSMGAAVGGLYASGLSVDSIGTLIATTDWDAVLADRVERDRRFLHQKRLDERTMLSLPLDGSSLRLAAGATNGSNVSRLAERATWSVAGVRSFDDLTRPFTAVATDLETGEAVPLTDGVLSEAIRASIGLPAVFEPFVLDGRLLVDGAISRNLPAIDVRRLGVDVVICSDVSEPPATGEELSSILDVLDQVVTLSMQRSTEEQRALCDIVVRPDTEGLNGGSWNEHAEWIARGAAAARAYRIEFERLAQEQRLRPVPTRPSVAAMGDSVRVTDVRIEGWTRSQTQELVTQEIGVTAGSFVSRDELASRLTNLDATGLFGQVRYRLDRVPDGVALIVRVEERPRDRLGVGLRYDDERRAALLFTTTLHNLVRYGSVTRLDLRVGEETQLSLSYLRRRSVTGRLEGGASLAWSQGRLRPAPTRVETGIDLISLSATFGLVPGRSTFLGIELLGEKANHGGGTLPDLLLGSASLILDHESLDELDFPRAGFDLTGRFELGLTDLTSGGDFTVATASGTAFLPLHDDWSVDIGGAVGRTSGVDLPVHRGLYLGGAHPSALFSATQPTFHGLPGQELTGEAVQVGRLGIRWRATGRVHVRAGVDVGGAMDRWTFPVDDPVVGWAVSAGTSTPVGPVVLQWARASHGYGQRLTVAVGRRF